MTGRRPSNAFPPTSSTRCSRRSLIAGPFKAAKVIAKGTARRARRGHRQDLFQCRSRRCSADKGRKGAAGPHRNFARRFARHDRGRRHSDRARRRQFARGAGRAPDGQGLRLRRSSAADRLRGQDPDRRWRRLSRKATFFRSTAPPAKFMPAKSRPPPSEIVQVLIEKTLDAQEEPDLPKLRAS